MALNSSTQLLTINERLPPEIMSEIFILCTTVKMRSLDDFDFEQDISTSSQLSLIYVCRLWRSIANSTPALWTSLRIYIPLNYRTNQSIQDIQQWISRSGQLPLSIQVHHNRSLPIIFPHPEGDDLINLVNSYSHRWESLEITLIPQLLPLFRDSSSGPSILKTLILAPVLTLGLRQHQHSFNIGASLPSPTCVSLSSTNVWPLGICWDEVTRFTARRTGLGQALEILRLPPQLQEFILFELERESDDDLPSPPVLHSRLETLHVYLSSKAISYQLMDSITLPSLKHFNYRGRYPPIDSIVDFLDRSECPLETFSLRDADIDGDDIIYLLRGMPHLESLTLGTRCITDGLLKLLATTAVLSPYQIDGIFLPKLQSLKCIGRPIFSWSWLPTVFGSRATDESGASDGASESGTFASDTSEAGTSEPGAFDRRPLRSFTVVQDVDDADYPEASVVEELEHLREEGYVIDIVFGRVKFCLDRSLDSQYLKIFCWQAAGSKRKSPKILRYKSFDY
jgi:hypothetical protein